MSYILWIYNKVLICLFKSQEMFLFLAQFQTSFENKINVTIWPLNLNTNVKEVLGLHECKERNRSRLQIKSKEHTHILSVMCKMIDAECSARAELLLQVLISTSDGRGFYKTGNV